jgi:hypothetical protein
MLVNRVVENVRKDQKKMELCHDDQMKRKCLLFSGYVTLKMSRWLNALITQCITRRHTVSGVSQIEPYPPNNTMPNNKS